MIKEIIDRSETALGIDVVYFSKNGVFLLLSYAVSAITGLILSYSYAHALSKEFFGTYSLFLAISQMIGIFGLPAMDTVITKAAAEKDTSIIVPAIKTTLRHSILGSLASLTTAGYFFLKNQQALGAAFVLFAFIFPFLSIANYYVDYKAGRKEFNIQSLLNIVHIILFAAISLIIIFTSNNIVLLAILPLSVSSLLYLIPTMIFAKKVERKPRHEHEGEAFGVRLSYSQALISIAEQLDQFVIGIFLGPVQLAIYYFVQFIPNQVTNAFKIVNSLSQPKIYERSEKVLRSDLGKKVWQLFTVAVIVCVSYIIIAPFIFKLFYPAYSSSVLYSQLFTLTLLAVPFNLFSFVFIKKMSWKIIRNFNLFYAILLIVLTLGLVPIFGIWGAIAAKIILRLVTSGVNAVLFRQVTTEV